MTLHDWAKASTILMIAIVSVVIVIIIAGALGMVVLAATLTMLETAPKVAFIFNGVPWIYVIWRFIVWVRDNLKQQSEDRLKWEE